MEQQTALTESAANNTKKMMKELLAKFNFSLPQRGAVIEGEIISATLLNVLIDLGSFGTGIVYPREFYDNLEKQKSLKPGQKVKAVVLNLENEEGLRELSLKRAQQKTAWQEIKEMYERGDIITLRIANLNKGGLISEVSGVQAFMPLSQLAEEHYPKVENGNIQEIVRILQTYRNQEFKVKIIDVNESENKLIISERAALDQTKEKKTIEYAVGELVEGEIVEVTDFGFFVRLKDGPDALMPKSEIEETVELKPGDSIKAKIIEVSPDKVVISSKNLKNEVELEK
ncbi:MAG: S1 RNA-binding domain-containing protein [Patescibacteria group bacterium]